MAGVIAAPSREDAFDARPSAASGGPGGTVAIPSRQVARSNPAPPSSGPEGPIVYLKRAWSFPLRWNTRDKILDAYNPAIQPVHGYYPNTAGRDTYTEPQTYSPGLSAYYQTPPPAEPIPVDSKPTIGWVRRMFGAWSQDYPSDDGQYYDIHPSKDERWRAQWYLPYGVPMVRAGIPRVPIQKDYHYRFGYKEQMESPYFNRLTKLARSQSYGSYTSVLPSVPMPGMEMIYG